MGAQGWLGYGKKEGPDEAVGLVKMLRPTSLFPFFHYFIEFAFNLRCRKQIFNIIWNQSVCVRGNASGPNISWWTILRCSQIFFSTDGRFGTRL